MHLKWLVVTRRRVDLPSLRRRLEDRGCQIAVGVRVVPLGASEQALAVEGPRNLAAVVRKDRDVVAVYPDSDHTLY